MCGGIRGVKDVITTSADVAAARMLTSAITEEVICNEATAKALTSASANEMIAAAVALMLTSVGAEAAIQFFISMKIAEDLWNGEVGMRLISAVSIGDMGIMSQVFTNMNKGAEDKIKYAGVGALTLTGMDATHESVLCRFAARWLCGEAGTSTAEALQGVTVDTGPEQTEQGTVASTMVTSAEEGPERIDSILRDLDEYLSSAVIIKHEEQMDQGEESCHRCCQSWIGPRSLMC
ncbi:hypothetical protein PoB_000185700 [Plakobranchus ocellatus]|uniref:Uncharacterized protein n=1 Tax=Plakobranchus ocellatus TaxID=259542 RepID=A0AAV3XZR4_9GAST|nr:hypothetical protein PoB_000185700 [Plakobranchus ocellatus]